MKIGAVPIVPKPKIAPQSTKPKEHTYVQEKRKRQKVQEDAPLFGGDLFKPIMQREREIVVSFPPIFCYDRTRISSCGRFAYRVFEINYKYLFDLYFIANPQEILIPGNEKFDQLKSLDEVYGIPTTINNFDPNNLGDFLLFARLDGDTFQVVCRKLATIAIGIIRAEIKQTRDQIVTDIFTKMKKEEEEKHLKETLIELEDELFLAKEDKVPEEEKISATKPIEEAIQSLKVQLGEELPKPQFISLSSLFKKG